MFRKESVAGRMVTGKIIGLIFGVIAIFTLPLTGMDLFNTFGVGMLLMFILMGQFIGLVGQYEKHPVFNFKMRWWFTGAVAGFFFTLMLALLSYSELEIIMNSSIMSWTGLESPFWVIIDGMIIGMIMSGIETKISGRGPLLPLR